MHTWNINYCAHYFNCYTFLFDYYIIFLDCIIMTQKFLFDFIKILLSEQREMVNVCKTDNELK